MKLITQMHERENRTKKQRKLRAEFASLHRKLSLKNSDFRRMMALKKKLELF